MTQVLKQIWRLCILFLQRDRKKLGLLCFVVALLLQLSGVYITIRMVTWVANFYDALQQLNTGEAIRQVGIFFFLIVVNSVRGLSAEYLEKVVQLRWRRELTYEVLEAWMNSQVYWRMKFLPPGRQVDNPDQRIADDCKIFLGNLLDHTNQSSGLVIGLITKIVSLCSFTAILWQLSTFPLVLQLFGHTMEIHRYMIWAAVIYVAISSCCTHFLGYPIKKLIFEQQRREADLRFSLVHIRQHSDEIALLQGERSEEKFAKERFEQVAVNWRALISKEFLLGCFTYPYTHSVLRIPLFVALPAYLAGQVSFGGLMQLSQAFSNVVTALSWFIFSYRRLADLVAASSRLANFLQGAELASKQKRGIEIDVAGGNCLQAKDFELQTPNGRCLLRFPELKLIAGRHVWLQGVSGLGKTTLLKAMAGFWPYGKGIIEKPEGNTLFLPQRPYFPLSNFKEALCYPESQERFSQVELEDALKAVGMENAIELLSKNESTEYAIKSFSGGEQQRLALARLLLLKPDWAFLDEATSALDKKAEQELLACLRKVLCQTTFILIAHRQPVGLGECERLDICPEEIQCFTEGYKDRACGCAAAI